MRGWKPLAPSRPKSQPRSPTATHGPSSRANHSCTVHGEQDQLHGVAVAGPAPRPRTRYGPGVIAWWLAGCAHRVPPPDPALPDEAGALVEVVERLALRGANLGRQRELGVLLEQAGLPVQRERIDWLSFQHNLLVELPGEREELIYVVAHSDKTDVNPLKLVSVLLAGVLDEAIGWSYGSRGAVDNATGVAVVAELARVMADEERRYTWRFLFAGSEESGLRGSRAHLARLGKRERDLIGLAINVDAVGARWSGNCVIENGTDDVATDLAIEAARAAGVPLERGRIPLGATSDHAPFRRTGPLTDLGRGLLFNLPGGLLPHRSWLVTPHTAPVVAYSACDLMGPGDWLGAMLALPTGHIHGPRDHLGQVDPTSLYQAWAAVRAFAEAVEAR